jgi:hypothetical protein
MTKPVNRPYKQRGFPQHEPPPNAAARIEALAAAGHSLIGIARGLNTGHNTLRRWINEYPKLAEALARGRASEEFALHNVLYRAATNDNNILAAIYLTKCRHGWIDRPPPGARDDDIPPTPVSVTINFKDASRKPLKK